MPISGVSLSQQPASAPPSSRARVATKRTDGSFSGVLSPEQETVAVGAIASAAGYAIISGAAKMTLFAVSPAASFVLAIVSLFRGFLKDKQDAIKREEEGINREREKRLAQLSEQTQRSIQNTEARKVITQLGKQKTYQVFQRTALGMVSIATFTACIYGRAANNCISTDHSKECIALGSMMITGLLCTILATILVVKRIIDKGMTEVSIMPINNVSQSQQPALAHPSSRARVTEKASAGGFTGALSPGQETATVGAIAGTAALSAAGYAIKRGEAKTTLSAVNPALIFMSGILFLFREFLKGIQDAIKREQEGIKREQEKRLAQLSEETQRSIQNTEDRKAITQLEKQKTYEVFQRAALVMVFIAMFTACNYARAANNCISTPDQSKDCKALGSMMLASLLGTYVAVHLVGFRIIDK